MSMTIWRKRQENLNNVLFPSVQERVLKKKQKIRKDFVRCKSIIRDDVLLLGPQVMIVDKSRVLKWFPIYEGPFTLVRNNRGKYPSTNLNWCFEMSRTLLFKTPRRTKWKRSKTTGPITIEKRRTTLYRKILASNQAGFPWKTSAMSKSFVYIGSQCDLLVAPRIAKNISYLVGEYVVPDATCTTVSTPTRQTGVKDT